MLLFATLTQPAAESSMQAAAASRVTDVTLKWLPPTPEERTAALAEAKFRFQRGALVGHARLAAEAFGGSFEGLAAGLDESGGSQASACSRGNPTGALTRPGNPAYVAAHAGTPALERRLAEVLTELLGDLTHDRMYEWYEEKLRAPLDAHATPVGLNGLLRVGHGKLKGFPCGSQSQGRRLSVREATGSSGNHSSRSERCLAANNFLHWLGFWCVTGRLHATANQTVTLLHSMIDHKAANAYRGVMHGAMWGYLGEKQPHNGAVSLDPRQTRRLTRAEAERLWHLGYRDSCRLSGFDCIALQCSCVHGIGHFAARFSHVALDVALPASLAPGSIARREAAARFPGIEVCEAATTRDLAYHCANGYYHQLSTWVDTLEARLRGGRPVAEPGDLKTTTWTHDVCVGAPLEAACLLRTFVSNFPPLPDAERPDPANTALVVPPATRAAMTFGHAHFADNRRHVWLDAIRRLDAQHVSCIEVDEPAAAAATGSVEGGRDATPQKRRRCVMNHLYHFCLGRKGIDTFGLKLACVTGASLFLSRALMWSEVDARVRLLFCTQLGQDDARYTDACMRSIVGWNGRRDHQIFFGADVLDTPVQE